MSKHHILKSSVLTNKVLQISFTVLALSLGHSVHAADTADEGYRQVNQVAWDKDGGAYQPIEAQALPENQANIVFMRPVDGDRLQTSANIGIDGEFHVSLQPGHYSQTTVCSGTRNISVVPTGLKNNILASNQATAVSLNPQQTYYYYVEVDDATGATKLTNITADSAAEILNVKTEQTHQLNRVTTNCPEVVQAPIVVAPPVPPVVVEPPAPIEIKLDQPVALDVLFEFDSARVLPVYNERVQAVYNYMNKYPSTVTRIEGHTDSTGPASYNMGLSQRRANAVAEELVNRYGANPSRLSTAGFGETQPVATNATKEGRQQNRRVVAIVSEQ